MSKKLTKSEQEFLVELISKKIVEKKSARLKEVVENNPKYIELQKRAEELQVLGKQLDKDCDELDKELCEELGMSGGWDNHPLNLSCNYNVTLGVHSVSSYKTRQDVQEKLMYEQIVLGGISENFIDKIVEELS